VFVIPENSLATAPAYVSSSAQTLFLATASNFTVNAQSVVTAYSPATYLFAATDGSGNLHIYSLNLASNTVPTATQVSSLSLPLAASAAVNSVICDSSSGFTNLLQPTTMFVVLHIAGTTGCGTTGDTWEVVHYTDAATKAPTVVGIKTTQITPLYAPSGDLSGLALLDPVSSNLYVYANDGFTAPTTAIAGGGISAITTLDDAREGAGGSFIGSTLFLAVTISGKNYLYRLPYNATTATLEYTATGALTGGAQDDTSLYFTDIVTASTITQTIWQIPLAGGATTELYNYPVPGGGEAYVLIGSNNSLLVMMTNATNGSTGAVTTTLATLRVGQLSTSATALESLSGFVTAFMLPTTSGTRSTDLVFTSAEDLSSGASYLFATAVVEPGGTVRQALTSNTYFLGSGSTSTLSGSVLRVSGINNAFDGMGGGPISAINLATFAPTPLKTTGGTAYTVPSGFDPTSTGMSNLIGAGVAFPQAGASGNDVGFAYDLSKDLIVPISISNTDVTLF
jgi:hypothetical protein